MEPIKKSPEADPLQPGPIPDSANSSDDEALDWDFRLEVAAKRPSGVVEADVEYQGRAKPLPFSDPRQSSAP
jgi:hypothetical protein